MAFFVDDYSLPHLQQEALAKAEKKGEGSRGGHIIGHTKSGKPIYSIGHEHYQHKEHHSDYYGKISPLDSGLSSGHAGKLVSQRFPDYSNQDHLEASSAHEAAAKQWGAKHRDALVAADHHAFGHLKESPAHFAMGTNSAGTHTSYLEGDNKLIESSHAASKGHESAAIAHLQAAGGQSVKKSQHGEGARGGHIIGHTKSGKPIYEASGSKYAHIKRNQVSEDHRSGGRVRRGYPKFTMMDHDDAHLMHADNEQVHNTAARRASENGRDDLAQAHLAIADSHMKAGLGHKYARQIMENRGHDYPRHVYHEAGMHAEMDTRPIKIADYGDIRDPFKHKSSLEQLDARAHNQHAVGQNFGHFNLKQHKDAIEHHQGMSSTLQNFLDDPTKKPTTKARDSSIRRQIKAHRALGLAHSDYANMKFGKTGV